MAFCDDPLRVSCMASVYTDGMVCDRCFAQRETVRTWTERAIRGLITRVTILPPSNVELELVETHHVQVRLVMPRDVINPGAVVDSVQRVLDHNAPLGTWVEVLEAQR